MEILVKKRIGVIGIRFTFFTVIGYEGDKEALPEDLQGREHPFERRSLEESVFEGTFK